MIDNSSTPRQVKEYLAKAKQAQQISDICQAIKHYQAALNLKFEQPIWVYLSLGRLYAQENNFERAQYYFDLAFQIYPNDFRSLSGLAMIAVKQQKWSLALKHWNTALEKFPNNIFALNGRANALIKLQRFDKASACLDRLCQKYSTEPNGIIGLAKLAIAQENWSLALKRWDLAAAKFSDNIDIFKGQANTLIQLRRFERAEISFQELCQKYSEQDVGFIGLAELAMAQKQWNLALTRWNIILNRFADNSSALRGRARVFIALRCFLEAKADGKRLHQEHPHLPDGLLILFEIALAQQQWNIALQKANELVEKFPRNINAWHKKGLVLMSLKHYEDAETVFKLIHNRFPQKPVGNQGLFDLAYDLPDLELAESRAKLLQKEFPELLSPLFSLAKVYFTIGDVDNLKKIINQIADNKHLLQKLSMHEEALEAFNIVRQNEIELGINFFRQAIDNNDYLNNSFLDLVALEIIIRAIREEKIDEINRILKIIYSKIRKPAVSFKMELTSIVYQLLGRHYQNKQQYTLASTNYKKSITINPNNSCSLQLLRSLISLQYASLKDNSDFMQKTTGEIAVMIISCQKNQSHISFLRKHLYQRLNLPYFFVIGKPNLSCDWVCESDILYVKSADDYNSLTAKVIKALECVYGLSNFKGILKFDDDVWIKNINEFLTFISWLKNDCAEDYFGRVVGRDGFMSAWRARCYHWGRGETNILENEPYKKPNFAQYCGGGEGYYLSRKSIKTIVEHYIKCPDSIYHEFFLEDKYVGETLSLHGIKPLERNLSQFGLISDVNINTLQHKYIEINKPDFDISADVLYQAIDN